MVFYIFLSGGHRVPHVCWALNHGNFFAGAEVHDVAQLLLFSCCSIARSQKK